MCPLREATNAFWAMHYPKTVVHPVLAGYWPTNGGAWAGDECFPTFRLDRPSPAEAAMAIGRPLKPPVQGSIRRRSPSATGL